MAGEKKGVFEKIKGAIKQIRDDARKPKFNFDVPSVSDDEFWDDDMESESVQDNKTRSKHSESDPLPRAESANENKENAAPTVQTLPRSRSWESRMERIRGSDSAEGRVVKTSASTSTEKPIDQQIEDTLKTPVPGSHRAKASQQVASNEKAPARTENSRGETAPLPPPKPSR